ncbi:MAG: hypothetical protein KCHDKBKB_02044 [Elusimicrobia bacterium]|nr:hypothetical protein [Elusimicrobiota bacterium]
MKKIEYGRNNNEAVNWTDADVYADYGWFD